MLRTRRRKSAAVAACLGVALIATIPFVMWRHSVADATWVTHTVSVRLIISDSVTLLRELELEVATGKPIDAAADNLAAQLRALEEITRDNGSQHARLNQLRTLLIQRPPPIYHMRRALATMDLEEQRLFDDRLEKVQVSRLYFAGTYVLGLVVAAAFAALWLFESRRIERERAYEQEALLRAKQKAETAARAQAQFISTMSHEIRTPMNGVLGFANLLLENPRDDQKESLNALQFSANHLLALLNDILDYSKIDAGRLEFERLAIEVPAIVVGTVQTLSTIARDKGVTVTVVPSPIAPMWGDAVRLKQILINLIGNAIKFSEGGRVTVAYRLDGAMVEVSVTDTGVGIAAEHLGKVFDAFTQAEPGTTRRFGGSGLGLAIVKNLVERQGGAITLESTLGRGTCVTFRLPYEAAEPRMDPSASPSPSPPRDDVSGMRVLVVEDSPVNLLLARRLLARWDVNVSEAVNGAIAVAKAESEAFDVIFMDLQMPELDGYEATRRIRHSASALSRGAPIIALTASASVEVAGEIAEAGMNGFLPKPFEVEALREVLRKHRAPART